MKDSKKKQIKFKPKHYAGSPAAGQQDNGNHSYVNLRKEGANTRQTTLEQFYFVAREGVKDLNVI